MAIGKLVKKGIQAKSNESEIRFTNGSRIWTSCSGRGGAAQFLHISELGPKSLKDPLVAIGKLVKKGIQAKSNESEIRFTNGSRIWTSCSGRGGV